MVTKRLVCGLALLTAALSVATVSLAFTVESPAVASIGILCAAVSVAAVLPSGPLKDCLDRALEGDDDE